MANPEHLAILKQGKEIWNKWRNENLDVIPDLSDAFLYRADLSEANLYRSNLYRAELSETDLSSANLSEANLGRADLRGTDLRGADLRGADLSRADLSRADLSEADLSSANLIEANLREANLYRADLSGANLSEADVNCAVLSRANLSEADLSSTNLNYTDLSNSNLYRSYLGSANLNWADLSSANLNWADLSSANLNWADLSKADLSGANLAISQVIGTNFHNATLTGVYIKDWQINSETKLDRVICEYVYLDVNKTERRPINGNFKLGEFASVCQKILENTDLILRETPENDNTVNKPEKNIDLDNTSNNQGVQFRSDRKIHTWERLRFRSKTEIKIAEALDRTGVLFVPNSLARLNTPKGRENKEADFLICYNGKWGVLEVDGPFHTAERRVEEQERERIFKKNGIKVVERFDYERCYNNPDEVVQEFFKMIEIGYS
ncbi:pentapeptide repeat-containing protein [Dolichospermum sp. UHCC 0259]|uniref:pentapeptide repeat-containing protein n=1 Tax=Dolichospermum sp. UHCC 0259 TaxID=2590010 RepID=UPI001C2D28B9|nr:pentapeptide repeat-containing protein [Dolichospermum sp. UHCC 0259]MTJ47590.1 DUF559 domain-containing protein [Dolichospermum sp. UHCC 0259]